MSMKCSVDRSHVFFNETLMLNEDKLNICNVAIKTY